MDHMIHGCGEDDEEEDEVTGSQGVEDGADRVPGLVSMIQQVRKVQEQDHEKGQQRKDHPLERVEQEAP